MESPDRPLDFAVSELGIHNIRINVVVFSAVRDDYCIQSKCSATCMR